MRLCLHPSPDTRPERGEYDWSRDRASRPTGDSDRPFGPEEETMDRKSQASATLERDAKVGDTSSLPEQSVAVLKGRADVERVRMRKLSGRLIRAILVLAALDLFMVN